ncbi:hypothetical protein F3Y22_tig00110339pilonHSYRG00084 [Hibiscus syriacus]|uniref:RNase H type-1 domain-containing protein n=1 Tax=Hibiscus syriacus TaxID=106335 RepID=A0A6A3AXI4_HIBSY|nr:hypothetical protein F3Y22_tig00110339pilonHSYRG00084 [Hibiscus syriacus]
MHKAEEHAVRSYLVHKAEEPAIRSYLVHKAEEPVESGKGTLHFVPTVPHFEESTIHILRDCTEAPAVWHNLLPTALHPSFYLLPLLECFGRPEMTVFNEVATSPIGILNKGITWGRYYYGCSMTSSLLSTGHQVSHWPGPEPGWICLNVDAAVSSTTSFDIIGGLFRDQTGSWLSGFQKAIGIVPVLQAELWAILSTFQFKKKEKRKKRKRYNAHS